jgi:hypothetical protein
VALPILCELEQDKYQEAIASIVRSEQAFFTPVRSRYLQALGEHNPEAALKADLGPGVTTYRDQKGRVMVRVPGQGEMLWRNAIQAYGPK